MSQRKRPEELKRAGSRSLRDVLETGKKMKQATSEVPYTDKRINDARAAAQMDDVGKLRAIAEALGQERFSVGHFLYFLNSAAHGNAAGAAEQLLVEWPGVGVELPTSESEVDDFADHFAKVFAVAADMQSFPTLAVFIDFARSRGANFAQGLALKVSTLYWYHLNRARSFAPDPSLESEARRSERIADGLRGAVQALDV